MRKIALALGLLAGTYLIVRAIAEPFVIDFGDPSSYAADWGGPSLIGVLAVHCLPGVLSAWLMVRMARRRFGRTSQHAGHGRAPVTSRGR
ncbi:hypothetical protein H9Y04_33980 [Streptomyces sp. TRM66268-LWL]|uniref:DUF2637 domain-containing protein n=1 Tax=Streptomyces polyasparticus TaxID=2767826 RepID=A0ABR7SSI5_9ACTN|nr:hypothetical protein [Streptomyces polyasparticus]MBC9717552.1 hypothetical protein [Streptomyces polyasparticus]